MKIAILVSAFPPKWLAGTEVATYNIAKYLANRGHEVHVITLLDEGTQKNEMKDRFNIHRIKLHYRIPIISIMIYYHNVEAIIKKIKPDIIHCQNLSLGWMPFLINFFDKYPYVIYGRGEDVYADYWLKKAILRKTIKNADAVITLTEDMKKKTSECYNRDIFVIPNGITLNRYEKKQSLNIDISNDEKVILYVGRLNAIKGVEYLIEAMDKVNRNYSNARLLLVGDGNLRRILENRVEKLGLSRCITFVGLVSTQDVSKYLANADIFVLPSLSEGFPNVILEAMAVGLPIITTKIRGLPEIVKEGINGYLVDPKNSDQLADKILDLLNNVEIAAMISENNRNDIKKYEWENIVKELENVYLTCTSSN